MAKRGFYVNNEHVYNRFSPVLWITSHVLRHPSWPTAMVLAGNGIAADVGVTLVYVIIGLTLLAGIIGWFYSPRTRKLTWFAVIVIAVAAALLGLLVLIRILWFPVPPL